MSNQHSHAIVPRDWLQDIAAQGPSKPDYWSACDQCERATAAAQDLITGETPPPEQVLYDEEIQKLWGIACHDDSIAGPSRQIRFARAIENAVLKQLGAKNEA